VGLTAKLDDIATRLDELGKPAWIAVIVLGFIAFWPLGLALLAYLIWSGRMGCGRHGGASRWQEFQSRMHGGGSHGSRPSSGNRAFDEYREETLRRLEEEQREFKGFLERLRLAKDKAEFDQFMADRARPQPGEQPSA
jgi:hypothetical protein